MASPRPKPHVLKIAQGNPGKRKLANAPNFNGKFGPAPKWMVKEASELWKKLCVELESKGLSAQAYGTALEALCVNYGRARHAEELLKKESMTFTTEEGYIGQHPAVNIAIKSWGMVGRFVVEFGLTPSAVGKVNLPRKHEQTLEELVS